METENLSWRKELMLDSKLLQSIDDTATALELASAVIEKDYYVTHIIHALSDIKNEFFQLVFAGGTCLAKAHKIVKRMSEDIDFKIQFKNIGKNFSKSRMLKELTQFRELINSKLKIEGLTSGQPRVLNKGQYSRIEITYPSAFIANPNLRPDILLEFTLSDIRLSIKNLPIKTLIEDTFKNIVLFAPSSTNCISTDETAIEKWVALTRRVIAIERGYHPNDETLIRHVYDLNAINRANKINNDFFTLAKEIVTTDAKKFKNQHPEYSTNPSAEIRESLALLKNKAIWQEHYEKFLIEMVYDSFPALEYEKAITKIEEISAEILDIL